MKISSGPSLDGVAIAHKISENFAKLRISDESTMTIKRPT